MANNTFKRSIAMLLVLNMLTGMVPVQALADEGDTTTNVVITIEPSSEKSAPAPKSESSSSEKSESAPAEKSESAPAEKTESAPAEKQEAAPAEEKTESAPAEEQVVIESASVETTAYDEPEGDSVVSETESFEGEEPELDYDSELTFGDKIDGVVTETTETETDEEGSTTVTETTEVETKGETEDGATIEGKETYTESETTNADGEVIGSYWEKDGVEITDKVVAEETGDEKEQTDVTVDLIPGEETEASVVTKETVEENTETGTTITTTETDRTVTAETSDVEVTVNDANTGLVKDKEAVLTGPAPVYDEEDGGIYGSNGALLDKVDGEHIGKEDVFDRNYLSSQTLDRITLENGIVVWVNDTSKIITNITAPEGVEIPEDFEYSVGSSVNDWYVASNPTKANLPSNYSSYKNDQKINKTDTVTYDKIVLDNGITLWVNDGDMTVAVITTAEGVEVPEDFEYGVGADVSAWYTAGSNPDAKHKPVGSSNVNNVKMNNVDNWYDADGNIIHAPFADAEFCYVGTGEHSKFYNAYVYVTYARDEEGNPILDENGEPVIESIKTSAGADVTANGEIATELPDGVSLKPVFDNYNGSRPTTFMLMDKNGNRVYAYCCDMRTGTSKGYWYDVSNLEDSDYYASEESEDHIRTIVLNGYWGTSDHEKEDGSHEMGSLEKIKQDLRDAIINGQMENTLITLPVLGEDGNAVVDEEGNPVTESKYMMEIIDDLSAGEALLATQSAIWSFANGSIAAGAGQDGSCVIDPDGYKWNHVDGSSKDGEIMDDWGGARVDFLYNWLVALETEEQSTTIINEKNFVEDMSLTVHDKAEGYDERNKDDDKDNDVYDTDLNFKLAFIPGENDDLLVQISYNDLDGKPVNVVRRLAGENAEGQNYEGITPDENGNYVLKGLKLSENEDFAFDLRLEGTQYLENGVYIYQAVGGRENSQTFVGVAEGERNVDVSIGVTIKFDVDENNHVVAERRWHSEKDPQRDPGETPPPPAEYRLGFGVGQLEVIEEEVPLAAPPQTGDMSILWFAMIAMSGCGLCILNLLEKRKCQA